MTDFINKVITLVLIFIMLVLAPLLISYVSMEMVTQRLVLNDVTQFIDKVTDKSLITEQDLNELYLSVNSHGSAYNVDVERYQAVEEPYPGSITKLIYVKHDDTQELMDGAVEYVALNTKDIVKVSVEEIISSESQRLLWTVLGYDTGDFSFTLAGTVR